MKRYICSYRRYYCELEDDFKYELFAKSRKVAFLTLFADLKEIYAVTRQEAIKKARTQLEAQFGKSWNVDKILKTSFPIWPDQTTCYEIQFILAQP
jgi:hypothetical protein